MVKIPMPKLISIDLDGTLVDSVPDLAWAVDSTLSAMHVAPAGVSRVRNWVGNGVPMLLRRALGDGDENAVHDKQVLTQARVLFDGFYGDHFATDSTVYEGVFDTLRWLESQDVKLALITNKPIGFTVPMLEALGLAPFFSWTLGGDSLASAKPDPMPLLHVANDAGFSPTQCAHIGDSTTDIKAAKNAGFSAIAVSFGYNHGRPIAESNPDRVIDHWSELEKLF